MKKVIEVKISKNSIGLYNSRVHVGDHDVVCLSLDFSHTFFSSLEEVNVEVISKNRDVIKIQQVQMVGEKGEVLLDNELFRLSGTIQNMIRLTKGTEVLYVNDSFNIQVIKGLEFEQDGEKIDISSFLAKITELAKETMVETYVHTQEQASSEWTIVHGLNKYPSVTVMDSSGREIIGDIQYVSKEKVIVRFTNEFSGKATLN